MRAIARRPAKSIESSKLKIEIIDGESVIGGGAAPSSVLPTRLLALSCAGLSADELSARLRASDPPIIARVEQGRVLLDLRTVFADQDAMIAAALHRIALRPFSIQICLAILYTIGHSTRTLDELIAALQAHQIQTLVDIRAFPDVAAAAAVQSRFSATKPAGSRNPIRLDEGAGRLSQKDSRRVADTSLCATRASAIMPTTCSRRNSSAPCQNCWRWPKILRTAYMCAERLYFRCHRMLVSDWLVAHGHEVLHIDAEGPVKPHKLTAEARIIDGRLIYRGDRLL